MQFTSCLLILSMADVMGTNEQPQLDIPTPESLPVQIEVLASELNVRPEELPLPGPVFPYAPYLQQRPDLMPNIAKYFGGKTSAPSDEQSSDSSSYDDRFEKDLAAFPWPSQLYGKIFSQRKLLNDD
ncbi:unnamed protein product [Cylicostephanus goldi]|uniref:Uncharacterized protein n=1 Tax=Cylicostephanus goldi TaxID=71465 RepID=A0A3P7M9V0_CYLGO|nr:unnamed protein product [Cylicostephanus goldi]